MADSVHDKLKKVRKPRVHITYDVETEGAQEVKELPFVIGVMGDFSGDPTEPLKPMKDRKFISIDRDNFDQVMRRMTPGLKMRVENTLKGDGSEMGVDLKFQSMEDFEPGRVVEQVEPLRKLMETRNKLRDLMTKADGSEQLENLLEQVLQNEGQLDDLRKQLDGAPAGKEYAPTADTQTQRAGAAAQTLEAGGVSLLDQAITATKATEPQEVQELLRALTEEANRGTVTFSKNLTVTMKRAIDAIDQQMSTQLAAIMHHEKFKGLEGSWRGLHYLVSNTSTGKDMKIRAMNVSKRELSRDLSKAIEFDQSTLFKKIYEGEFGTPGGEPYGALIGDYYFDNGQDDIELLRNISSVSAAAFAPFISAAGPKMFGFETFEELSKPRDLADKFLATEFNKWRGFRDTEDSRFVTLTMPRVLARQPYGHATKAIDEFGYEEAPYDAQGNARPMGHDDYCWMNSAYALATRMTSAFSDYGWCTAIRGAEGGGKVSNLPTHMFMSDDGDMSEQCPSEIAITSRREKELSDLGFLPLCHYKNTDYSVFFGAQTTQRPKKYDRNEATENAAISARLPYIMATSRFAHYLKVMARDKIGSFMEVEDCSNWLNRWIMNYVNSAEGGGQEIRAKYPLRDARVEVTEVPGSPGSYNAVAYLRPWLQMEELTASLRLVARIPQKA